MSVVEWSGGCNECSGVVGVVVVSVVEWLGGCSECSGVVGWL